MAHVIIPAGQYFFLGGRIHPGLGGQTRALLLRARLFVEHAGVAPVLLSLDDSPHYAQMRQLLRRQGELTGDTRLINLFEWHRENDLDDLPETGEELSELTGYDRIEVQHPDGTLYQTRHVTPFGRDPMVVDHHRPDGSVYLRVPFGPPGTTSRLTRVLLTNSKGRPVGSWGSQRDMRKAWLLRLMEPDRPAFLICDSRFAIADILPMRDPRLSVLHVVHNLHTQGGDTVNSPVNRQYLPLLTQKHALDAMITLTERQKHDIAARFGDTDNMYVVSHPVDVSAPPDPLPVREPKRFVMLGRLERQKRMEDAVQAFALVLEEEPDARLDIYGKGSLHAHLAAEIESRGLGHAVTLRGHSPQAADVLWTATAMLVTSRFEAFPLGILEARARGCPVIAYDIKYGPREQITSGVDGFLAPAGDVRALAADIVRLVREPGLATRLSAAARENATHSQGPRAVMQTWRGVLEQVVARRPDRTTIDKVTLDVTRLGHRRALRLPDRLARGALRRFGGRRSGSAGFRVPPALEFGGRLKVTGSSERSTLDDARITLDAVERETGASVPLPLTADRTGPQTFRLRSRFDPGLALRPIGGAGPIDLRLRLVWHNSTWEAMLARPRRLAPAYEFAYAADGTLSLLRGPRRQP